MRKGFVILLCLMALAGCQMGVEDMTLSITNETTVSQTVNVTQSRTGKVKQLTVNAGTQQDFSIEKGYRAELTGNYCYKYKLLQGSYSLTITDKDKQRYTVRNNLPIAITLKNYPDNSSSPTISISVPTFSFTSEYDGEFLAFPEELSNDWRLEENQQQASELYSYIVYNNERISYTIDVHEYRISINRVLNH